MMNIKRVGWCRRGRRLGSDYGRAPCLTGERYRCEALLHRARLAGLHPAPTTPAEHQKAPDVG